MGEKAGMNIHHFCSQTNSVELPAHLTRVSRDMHTVDKHRVVSDRYREPQVYIVCSSRFLNSLAVLTDFNNEIQKAGRLTEREIKHNGVLLPIAPCSRQSLKSQHLTTCQQDVFATGL